MELDYYGLQELDLTKIPAITITSGTLSETNLPHTLEIQSALNFGVDVVVHLPKLIYGADQSKVELTELRIPCSRCIYKKYGQPANPTICGTHDVILSNKEVFSISVNIVSGKLFIRINSIAATDKYGVVAVTDKHSADYICHTALNPNGQLVVKPDVTKAYVDQQITSVKSWASATFATK